LRSCPPHHNGIRDIKILPRPHFNTKLRNLESNSVQIKGYHHLMSVHLYNYTILSGGEGGVMGGGEVGRVEGGETLATKNQLMGSLSNLTDRFSSIYRHAHTHLHQI